MKVKNLKIMYFPIAFKHFFSTVCLSLLPLPRELEKNSSLLKYYCLQTKSFPNFS